jgi:pre-mRNA-processing factor SLU7
VQEKTVPKSKYEEDVFINNHTTVWGSWWKDHQWGYKCCKQFIRNSYCTGQAGIDAAEASADLMRANIERKEAIEDKPQGKEEKNLATWGSEVADDLVLDKKKLKDALKKASFSPLFCGLHDVSTSLCANFICLLQKLLC